MKKGRHGQPDKFENFPKWGLQPPLPFTWIHLWSLRMYWTKRGENMKIKGVNSDIKFKMTFYRIIRRSKRHQNLKFSRKKIS